MLPNGCETGCKEFTDGEVKHHPNCQYYELEKNKLIEPRHIGDGLYLEDEGFNVSIAVNHHTNKVAYLDIHDIDNAINYLRLVKERINIS